MKTQLVIRAVPQDYNRPQGFNFKNQFGIYEGSRMLIIGVLKELESILKEVNKLQSETKG